MKAEMSAEKAKEIEECAAKIAELLQGAKTLDEAVIPDSVKNLSVFKLEGSPVRVKNMLGNMGVRTLWELAHLDIRSKGSDPSVYVLLYKLVLRRW